ncbi:hypothetical protein RJ640_016840, partial [Escallonia rubra]
MSALSCYFNILVYLYKKEWNASVSCSHITWSKEPNITKYGVGLITVDKEKWRTTYYYSAKDVRASCSSANFEMAGMLCKYILYIFKKKKIIDLPEYYILPRWTINARYKVGYVDDRMDEISRYSAEKGVSLLTLWSVRAKFSRAIENARNSPSEICEVDSWLSSFLEKQDARKNEENFIGGKMGNQVDSSIGISQVESMNQISIRDPTAPVKTKGRPKVATRLKSSVELAKEEKKQRNCAYCHGKGHYPTGCAKQKEYLPQGSLDYITIAEEGDGKSISRYVPLHKAALAVRAKITADGETALVVAVQSKKRNAFVKKLLEKMLLPDVALTENNGATALHFAAMTGNIEAAKLLVKKDPKLPNVEDFNKALPINRAAIFGRREMVLYLFTVTQEDGEQKPYEGESGGRLLHVLIRNGVYDVALFLLQRYPKLAGDDPSPLHPIAGQPHAFPSGKRFNIWKKLIYS